MLALPLLWQQAMTENTLQALKIIASGSAIGLGLSYQGSEQKDRITLDPHSSLLQCLIVLPRLSLI